MKNLVAVAVFNRKAKHLSDLPKLFCYSTIIKSVIVEPKESFIEK